MAEVEVWEPRLSVRLLEVPERPEAGLCRFSGLFGRLLSLRVILLFFCHFLCLGRNRIVAKSGRYTKTWIQPYASITVNAQ